MAASAFRVQPHDAHAHDVTGAIDRQTTANLRRLIEVFTKSPAPARAARTDLQSLKRAGLREPRIQQTRVQFNRGMEVREAGGRAGAGRRAVTIRKRRLSGKRF